MGRPPMEELKIQVGFRWSADVVRGIESTGRGYNARVDALVQSAVAAWFLLWTFKMKLSGWHRIGIVSSLAWMLGGTVCNHIFEYAAVDKRETAAFNLCYRIRTSVPKYDGSEALDLCSKASFERRSADNAAIWWDDIFFALWPVIVGWPVAYGVIGLTRWVRRGFAHNMCAEGLCPTSN
jgi:hypothetical protein